MHSTWSVAVILLIVAQLSHCDQNPPPHTFKKEQDLLSAIKSVDYALVLSVGSGNAECQKVVTQRTESLQKMLSHSTESGIPAGTELFILKDKSYETKRQFRGCPNLVFYRKTIPIVFEKGSEEFSLESVSWWISANLDSVVRQLNDDNFEHLVQAATGSTTGDWVIWFHEQACSDIVAVWNALAARLRYTKVVAEVHTDQSPNLMKRFKLKSCQNFLMFSHGKYYIYTGDVFTLQAFANFAEVSYKNFKANTVKAPPSPFDEKIEEIVDWVKETDFGLCILIASTTILFISVVCLVVKEAKEKPQYIKED